MHSNNLLFKTKKKKKTMAFDNNYFKNQSNKTENTN